MKARETMPQNKAIVTTGVAIEPANKAVKKLSFDDFKRPAPIAKAPPTEDEELPPDLLEEEGSRFLRAYKQATSKMGPRPTELKRRTEHDLITTGSIVKNFLFGD
jgi:hypothetical protein